MLAVTATAAAIWAMLRSRIVGNSIGAHKLVLALPACVCEPERVEVIKFAIWI